MTPSAPGMGTQSLGHLPYPIDVTSSPFYTKTMFTIPLMLMKVPIQLPNSYCLFVLDLPTTFCLILFLIEICTNT